MVDRDKVFQLFIALSSARYALKTSLEVNPSHTEKIVREAWSQIEIFEKITQQLDREQMEKLTGLKLPDNKF